MSLRLKPINKQVMVITGASSGIGLATARLAARRGAKVVLAARNEEALAQIVNDITSEGGEAIYVTADVSDEEAVRRIADSAITAYGRIDTWVNDASVAIYGEFDDVSITDQRRLMEVNFWGVVYGCREAARKMRQRGGAIINMGSVLSDRAIPLQSAYVAAKHAVKGYTDVMRMELERAHVPISVTLVKPASINTPYFDHAKNYMKVKPKPAGPVYSPRTVARVILYCAQHPHRDVTIGGSGKLVAALGQLAPRLSDRWMERKMFQSQQSRTPATHNGHDRNNLYRATDDGQVSGRHKGHVMKSSAYTQAAMHPVASLLVLMAAGAAVAVGLSPKKAA